MTALVLENLAALLAQMQGLRTQLAKLARSIDALVSARAARQVPEWRTRQVRREITRYKILIRGQYRPQQVAKDYLAYIRSGSFLAGLGQRLNLSALR